MFQRLISGHMQTPASKCAIWEKIQTGVGCGDTFLKINLKFLDFHFTLASSRQSKTSPLDIPQSCVAPLGNSKAKIQDRWNFHMIFSQSLLEVSLLFELTPEISTCSFFNTPWSSISSTPPPPTWLFFWNRPMPTRVLIWKLYLIWNQN